MSKSIKEKRLHNRYGTTAKIYFQFEYDVETKVKFRVKKNVLEDRISKRHSAISKNVSTEGICFISNIKLHQGDYLKMNVYLPGEGKAINMDGKVRWSKEAFAPQEIPLIYNDEKSERTDHSTYTQPNNISQQYDTGVKLITVNGKSVHDSIYYDNDYNLFWSDVLDSVLGKYCVIVQERKKS